MRLSPILAAIGATLLASAAPARSFISPMGEPFRDMVDGKTPPQVWFAGADRDGDGRLTRAEFVADARRFFTLLDVNHDGEIGPEEIDRYEDEIAPEVRTDGMGDIPAGNGQGGHSGGGHHRGGGGGGGGRHGGGGGGGGEGGEGSGSPADGDASKPSYDSIAQGAARFGYLDLPEPVIAADTDFNRGVTLREWLAAAEQRFTLLDANHDNVITPDELPHLRGGGERPNRREHGAGGRHRGGDRDGPPPQ